MKDTKNGKKINIGNLLLLITLSLIIIAFSISFFTKEAKSFSEEENRSLQAFPKFSLSKLFEGTYTEQLHDFYSDQISLRSIMIELKAGTELAMGKNENNSIILGKDGYLIDKNEYTEENYAFLQENIKKISDFQQELKDSGISASTVLVPRKIDVLTDKLPPYYSTERNQNAWNYVTDDGILTLTDALTEAQKNGTEVFYKTDHHWTSEGAYYAYLELGKVLGYTPLSLESFNLTVADEAFFGTTYSKSGFFSASPDTLEIPENSSDHITTVVDTDVSFEGFYDFSYLEKKDKYSLFISGNNAHVSVCDTESEDKEKLLLVKDSFSHALVPYLTQHFDIELIDLRYYTDSLSDFIEENGIQNVLFIYGLDTLASADVKIR